MNIQPLKTRSAETDVPPGLISSISRKAAVSGGFSGFGKEDLGALGRDGGEHGEVEPGEVAIGGVVGAAEGDAGASVPAASERSVSPRAPPGGATWIRYAAIIAIAIVLIVLYVRGYR